VRSLRSQDESGCAAGLRSLPFSGNFAGWLRELAATCGLSTGDLVMQLAQTLFGESDDSGVGNVVTSVREQTSRET
jgi:hypothetical protein